MTELAEFAEDKVAEDVWAEAAAAARASSAVACAEERVTSAVLWAASIASPATVAAAAAAAFMASPGSAPAVGSDDPWARLRNDEGGGIQPVETGAVRRIALSPCGDHAPSGM